MNSYLILHGWQNHRPKEHWQHWLADRLGELGHHVVYPSCPTPTSPTWTCGWVNSPAVSTS